MGIIGFMRGLTNDVANDGIIANAVLLPGLVNTLATAPSRKSRSAPPGDTRPLGEPKDMTGAVLLLASDDAASITGEAIVVDSGQYRIG